jgi:Skp family chaperone for outer membrane proteins
MAGPVATFAQNTPSDLAGPLPQSSILTLKQDVFFEGSAFGRSVIERLQEATRQLQAENREIEKQLEAEERNLTARRSTLPAEEFRKLAQDFDTKVEGIRQAQDAKVRDLTRQSETDRQRFFERAVPILADIMRDFGAVALMDQSALILSFDGIDITTIAIERIDSVLDPADAPSEAAPETKP